MLYAVYRDPRPVRLLQWGVLAGLAGIAYAQQKGMLEEAADRFLGSVEHRADYADDSIEHRAELIHAALEAMHECYLLGLGIEGAYERIAEDSGNAVHVYQLGIVLIAGIPGASLLFWGIFIIGRRLAQQGEHEWAAFLGAHFLACTVTTVLFLSVQTYPVVIAASVLVIREREQRERQLRQQRDQQKSLPRAGAPQRAPAAMRRAA
jgi:hypothetical protein